MAISAKDVNKLRQMTGAGMMDCKKALTEADGDFDKAIEILRKKGQKVSEKRQDREASEGVVFFKANPENTFGMLVAVGSETDFVAKNEEFIKMGQSIIDAAFASRPASAQEVLQLTIGQQTVEQLITDMIGRIGEKLEIKAYETVEADTVVGYIHSNKKIGVLVGLNAGGSEALQEAGHDVAMQIAAMNPIALNKDEVPAEVVERELKLGREKALKEGKPENIVDKIAQGTLNKYFKENTLVDQAFVKDNSQSVGKYLQSVQKGLEITEFKRVALG